MKTIKERAAQLLKSRSDEEAIGNAFALLQELVDAPEPEPVARVTGYYAGYLSIATVDGRVLPAGTALYLAPPAPSVPDVDWLSNVIRSADGHHRLGAGVLAEKIREAMLAAPTPAPSVPDGWKHDCAGILQNDVELWLDSCPHCGKPRPAASPTPTKAPADVARDAERWRMLPAFLEEFEISYLRLEDAIDAAIEREKGCA